MATLLETSGNEDQVLAYGAAESRAVVATAINDVAVESPVKVLSKSCQPLSLCVRAMAANGSRGDDVPFMGQASARFASDPTRSGVVAKALYQKPDGRGSKPSQNGSICYAACAICRHPTEYPRR